MIYALGDVSGAHFNPAVTVSILLSKRKVKVLGKEFDWNLGAKYIGAQLVGGIFAALTYRAIYSGGSFMLATGLKFGWAEVAAAEAIATFVLCYVVLCVAVSTTTHS